MINNGHISNFFNLERGCRQGDPLSPYLFIIGVELLSLQIKSNPKIKGALVNDTESLISQYADDTFLVLDGCETSLRETLICFENFYKASGLKINTSKTRVVWVGNKRYSNQILSPDFKLNWSVINFKLLGIDFSLDLSSMPDLNFRKKIIDVSKILKSWQHRKLTLLGKVTVIKTLALPKLIHLLTSLPNLKQSLFNDLNKLFFNFIWDGKPEKIKRNTLIADYDTFTTVQCLSQNKLDKNILFQFEKVAGNMGGERICSLQKEKILEISKIFSNPFWKDVFYSLYSKATCKIEYKGVFIS